MDQPTEDCVKCPVCRFPVALFDEDDIRHLSGSELCVSQNQYLGAGELVER